MSEDHPKSKNNPLGAGRPYHKIDWEKVDRCLEAGLSGVQAAAFIGVHHQTLYEAVEREYGLKFSEYSAEKSAKGETMIGLKQFQEAIKGDRGMLIWLGKQRLGQRDNKDSRLDHGGTPTITIANFGDNPNPLPYQAHQELPSNE